MAMARKDYRLIPALQEMASRAPAVVDMPLVQIVSNPVSGGHSARRLARLRDAYIRCGFDVVFSESSPATPFQLIKGVARLCIAGGDGTVRHVLEQGDLRGSTAAVDVYPAGTINLIAREWDVPTDPDAFVQKSINRAPRPLFPVQLNDTNFLACVSVGPDARAVAGLSAALKRRIGRLAYVVAMMKVLMDWQRPRLRVFVDGERIDCEAVFIAKGRFYAGPWSFAPAARLDEPILHVVALRRARRRDFAAFFLAMMAGKTGNLENVQLATGREVTIDCDTPQSIQADGDIAAHTPASLIVAAAPLLL